MSPQLKREILRGWPPGGWQWVEPRTNWTMPLPLAVTHDQAVEKIVEHRSANPRLGLSTDPAVVARELDAYTCARLGNNSKFVVMVDDAPPPPLGGMVIGVKKKAEVYLPWRWVERVAESAADTSLDVAREWLGEGGKPVDASLAANRAVTCATCPGNVGGDWRRWFTRPTAYVVSKALEYKNAHRYATPNDEKLGVCKFCKCELKLKVHVPLAVIRENESADVLAALDPRCWINKEAQP